MMDLLWSGYMFVSGMSFVLLVLYCVYDSGTQIFDLEELGSTRNVLAVVVGAVFWPIVLAYALWQLKKAY